MPLIESINYGAHISACRLRTLDFQHYTIFNYKRELGYNSLFSLIIKLIIKKVIFNYKRLLSIKKYQLKKSRCIPEVSLGSHHLSWPAVFPYRLFAIESYFYFIFLFSFGLITRLKGIPFPSIKKGVYIS